MPGTRYTLEVVDAENGWAMAEWTRRGRNRNVSELDVAAIRASAERGDMTEFVVSDEGVLELHARLQPWAIALLGPA